MGEKTVTLRAHTVDLLTERHMLQMQYENLVKEMYGFGAHHIENDNDFIRNALMDDIRQVKKDIESLMHIKRLKEVHYDD